MDKKYELTEETKTVSGDQVYRIRALRSFGTVFAGDLVSVVSTPSCIYGQAVVK